jgi:hypothetical protein
LQRFGPENGRLLTNSWGELCFWYTLSFAHNG